MIKIGKYNLGRDEFIISLPFEDNYNVLSTRTKRNINSFINFTGFEAKTIYIGYRNFISRKSYYIEGHIDGNHIIYARKESNSPCAGQTYVYSENGYKQFNKLMTSSSKDQLLFEIKL